MKSQLSAALRKAGGSLAVRDISVVVKPEDVLDSENLTTLFVVVSKFGVKDWEATYEGLCDFVVRGRAAAPARPAGARAHRGCHSGAAGAVAGSGWRRLRTARAHKPPSQTRPPRAPARPVPPPSTGASQHAQGGRGH